MQLLQQIVSNSKKFILIQLLGTANAKDIKTDYYITYSTLASSYHGPGEILLTQSFTHSGFPSSVIGHILLYMRSVTWPLCKKSAKLVTFPRTRRKNCYKHFECVSISKNR